jgi:hypothetical protein
MTHQIQLKADSFFTIDGEKSGDYAHALSVESTPDLQSAFLSCRKTSDWSNPVFGGTSVRREAYIRKELNNRGVYRIGEYCPVFGYHEYGV